MIAGLPAVFGGLAVAAVVEWPYADVVPGWFRVWYGLAGIGHLVAAVQLFRLRWSGPALFAALIAGALVAGELLAPAYAARSVPATLGAAAVALAYAAVVSAYRDRFRPWRRPHRPQPP